MNRLVLIDGNAIMHRAYHALPPLTTKKGEPINAVYGFVSMLLGLINDLKPSHIAVCFDRPEETFRRKKYVKYQAQRPEMDEFLSSQITKMHDVLGSFGIPVYEKAGFEADDVLGTLAKRAVNDTKILRYKDIGKKKSRNIAISKYRNIPSIDEVVIVTGDRDIFQLINEKVKVYVPVKGLKEGKLYGVEEVEHEFDFEPIQMIDYKSLVGDPSDNYPGVPGIGPKTAITLLSKYKSKSKIYKHLEEISETTREKLKKGKDMADMSYELATIKTDVPIKIDLKKMEDWDLGSREAVELFMSYGFRTLLNRITNKNGINANLQVADNNIAVNNKNPKKEKTPNNQGSLF